MKILLVAISLTAFNAFALENLGDLEPVANDSINTELSTLNSH